MLLGQQIEVFTDHKNMVCKCLNTEQAVRWRLLSEESGPNLSCVKGMNNIVLMLSADQTEGFSAEAFAGELANEEEEFPMGCPLSHKERAFRQKKDRAPQKKFRMQPELCIEKPRTFSDGTGELITENDEIRFPEHSQHKCAKWCHLTSMHPGEQRLELTTAQHHMLACLDWPACCMRACMQTL